jgi:curli production assembly/transport component CsgE
MLHATLIAVFSAAVPPVAVPADTIPRVATGEPARVHALPSGLSYEELRRALARLRPAPAGAARQAENGADGIARREIDGLIVDETTTKIGRDFYQVFHSAWEAPPRARNYTLRVQEQPSPSLGTRVVVLLNDEVLFQLQLQPRFELIEELAQQAALYTRQEVEARQPDAIPAAAGDAVGARPAP